MGLHKSSPYTKGLALCAGVDEKQHFKYAFTACEVLCCEVDQIYSALLDDEELVAKLFSFLDAPRPLNLTKAGYFARVVLCLLVKRSSEVVSFLEAHPAIVERLVEHIDTTSIAEVPSSSMHMPAGFAWKVQKHTS